MAGILLMCGISYSLLSRQLVRHEGSGSAMAKAMGENLRDDRKGNLSLLLYVLGIAVALFAPMLALAIYVLVAIVWFIPDRRIEQAISPEARCSP